MPSWPVHIALARKVNKKLHLNDNFIIGNILPDVLNGHIVDGTSKIIDTTITHYRKNHTENNLSLFLSKYKDKLSNPIILGYACHLITDFYFNRYFFERHTTLKDDKRWAILNDGSEFYDDKLMPWRIKQLDFEMFGKFLSNNNQLGKVIDKTDDTINLISEIKEISITEEDIKKTINEVNKFIISKYNDNEEYKMFTKEELETLYEGCYKEIIKFLNDNELITNL